MKSKKGLFLLVTPLLLGATPKATRTIVPSTSRIGPFEVFQDDVTSTYTITSTLLKKATVYEKINFRDIYSGSVFNYTSSSHTINANSKLSFPFTIPTSGQMGLHGMKMSIGVYNAEDDSKYQSFTTTIYPIGHDIINPLDYLDNGYSTKNTAFSFPSQGFRETLIFTNYNDYFLTDIYYRLPFEQFDIKVDTSYKNLPLATGQMIIKNGGQLFPNLTSINNDIYINLSMIKVDDIFRLCLKTSLYVNPTTLNMSSFPISGYVATDNFYFPVNRIDEMQGLNIEFNVMNFGYNKTNLTWTSTFSPTYPFIGACNNSEYCVVGGAN